MSKKKKSTGRWLRLRGAPLAALGLLAQLGTSACIFEAEETVPPQVPPQPYSSDMGEGWDLSKNNGSQDMEFVAPQAPPTDMGNAGEDMEVVAPQPPPQPDPMDMDVIAPQPPPPEDMEMPPPPQPPPGDMDIIPPQPPPPEDMEMPPPPQPPPQDMGGDMDADMMLPPPPQPPQQPPPHPPPQPPPRDMG